MIITILVSIIFGILIGITIMYLNQKKFNKKNNMQYELKKTKNDLNNYQIEISNYFHHCSELLNILIEDYHKLSQYMSEESKKLVPNISKKNNFFCELSRNREKKLQIPRDYSDNILD